MQFCSCHCFIIQGLRVQPKAGRAFQHRFKAHGKLRVDSAFAINNFVDDRLAYARLFGNFFCVKFKASISSCKRIPGCTA